MFNFNSKVENFPTVKFKELLFNYNREYYDSLNISSLNSTGTLFIDRCSLERNNKIQIRMEFDPRFKTAKLILDLDNAEEYKMFRKFSIDIEHMRNDLKQMSEILNSITCYMYSCNDKKEEANDENN